MITMISITRELVPLGTGSFADFVPVWYRVLLRELVLFGTDFGSAYLVSVGMG